MVIYVLNSLTGYKFDLDWGILLVEISPNLWSLSILQNKSPNLVSKRPIFQNSLCGHIWLSIINIIQSYIKMPAFWKEACTKGPHCGRGAAYGNAYQPPHPESNQEFWKIVRFDIKFHYWFSKMKLTIFSYHCY